MFVHKICSWAVGGTIAVYGAASPLARAEMRSANASVNPFTASLQIAAGEAARMTGQFLDLQASVAPLFAGRTVPEIADQLQEVLQLDATVPGQRLDTQAVAHELEVGREIALGFSAKQIRLITGSAGNLRDDDLVVIVLASDPAKRTVSVRGATMRNTRIYP